MNGLEESALARMEVAGGCQPNPALELGTEVRDNVTEEIVGHNDVELVGSPHHLHGQDIHVEMTALDSRILRCDLFVDPLPEVVSVPHRVGFVGHAHVLETMLVGMLVGRADDALHAFAGVQLGLDGHLIGSAAFELSANAGVEPLGVLAKHHEVDVLGTAVFQRGVAGIQELAGPVVDIEVELESGAEQDVLGVDIGGDTGIAQGAEKHGVIVVAEGLHFIRGDGDAISKVPLSAVVELLKAQVELVDAVEVFEDSNALVDDFTADAIARNDCKLRHGSSAFSGGNLYRWVPRPSKPLSLIDGRLSQCNSKGRGVPRSMSTYFLRKDGSEYLVSSQEALVRLVQMGLVAGEDRLRRDGEKRFRKAESFPELKASFAADAWDVWETLGDEDPETIWAESTEWVGGEAAKTPSPAPEKPQEDPAEIETEPEPPIALRSREESPVEEETSSRSEEPPEVLSPGPEITVEEDSNVIVFPSPSSAPLRRKAGSAQPRPMASYEPPPMPEMAPKTVVRRPSPPRQFRAFPWVFGSILVVGVVVLVALNSHIKTTANWTSAGPEGPPPEEVLAQAEQFTPQNPPPSDAEAEKPDEMELLFESKVTALRERLSRGVTEMRGQPDDLTNALMIEMSRMRVGLLRLKAPVHAWGGPQNDLPVAADVHIVMSKQDDLIEQLGAAVLVVGKYLQAYEMEFQEFVVGIQEASGIVQERTISAEGAEAVFSNRMSLRTLLTE